MPEQEMFVIWSVKHALWWRADEIGYTQHLNEAGTYTAEQCDEIEERSQGAQRFSQISVRIPVARVLNTRTDRVSPTA
jgi:hypothetical protein